MFWYEFEVRSLERAFRHRPAPGSTPPVVFYGSSSIRLWESLATDLGDPRIINLGFGGSTLAACEHYFERLVVPRRPGSLVVYAGDNDLAGGRSAADIHGSFRGLLAEVDALCGPIPFAFISIKPSLAWWPMIDTIRAANSAIRADLARRPHSTYIDVDHAMLGPDGRPRAGLFLEDGLHLSPEGYRVWAERILAHRDAIF